MTAYVVAGLVQAKAAGTQVNDDAVNKGVAWLQKDFAADPKLAADLRAYMVYALAVASPNATQQISSGVRCPSETHRPTAWRCSAWRWNTPKDARAADARRIP